MTFSLSLSLSATLGGLYLEVVPGDVDQFVVDLVLDVGEEPEGAGASCCTPLVSSGVLREVVTAGDAAAVHAAAGNKDLEGDVVVASAIVAVAVVATTTQACLEVAIQEGCELEAEVKAEASKPGGRRSCPP